MGRKNTFESDVLKKNKTFNKLKYKDAIKWKDNVDISEFITKLNNYYDKFENSILENSTKLDNYIDYKLLATVEINTHLKAKFEDEKIMYIITDDEYKNLYISVCENHIVSATISVLTFKSIK